MQGLTINIPILRVPYTIVHRGITYIEIADVPCHKITQDMDEDQVRNMLCGCVDDDFNSKAALHYNNAAIENIVEEYVEAYKDAQAQEETENFLRVAR